MGTSFSSVTTAAGDKQARKEILALEGCNWVVQHLRPATLNSCGSYCEDSQDQCTYSPDTTLLVLCTYTYFTRVQLLDLSHSKNAGCVP